MLCFQHLSKLGKEKSGDSLRRAVAASGMIKENTTTTIPSDSVTLASDGGNSDKAGMGTTPVTGTCSLVVFYYLYQDLVARC